MPDSMSVKYVLCSQETLGPVVTMSAPLVGAVSVGTAEHRAGVSLTGLGRDLWEGWLPPRGDAETVRPSGAGAAILSSPLSTALGL